MAEDLAIGDAVEVPGNMFGTVRFVGAVQGKKGVFAGVELNPEFAARGKNNGDVDGYVVAPFGSFSCIVPIVVGLLGPWLSCVCRLWHPERDDPA